MPSLSRAPCQAGETAAHERHRHVISAGLALHPLGVRVVEVAAELPGHLEILIIAVWPQPLVALLRVPLAKAARVNLSHRRTPSYRALPGIATSDS